MENMKEELQNAIESQPPIESPLDQLVREAKVLLDEEIKDDTTVLGIVTEKGMIPVLTLGNISLLIGKAKSRKTFLITLIVAIMLGYENSTIRGIEVPGRKKIILFDTEQSRSHVHRLLSRINRLINGLPMNVDVYSLRKYTPEQRKEAIEHIIRKESNLVAAFIDGVKDLVYDINDATEATEVTTYLMKLSEENDIQICTVLHQNKDNNNARGHLGTELVNKSETVIQVEVDKNDKSIAVVSSEFTRDMGFDEFAFAIDDTGLPYVIDGWAKPGDKKEKKLQPEEVNPETYHKVLKEMFRKNSDLSYNELKDSLQMEFRQYAITVSDNRAKGFINYAKIQGWITNTGRGGTRNSKYHYTPGSQDTSTIHKLS
jgi:hypothetical protein